MMTPNEQLSDFIDMGSLPDTLYLAFRMQASWEAMGIVMDRRDATPSRRYTGRFLAHILLVKKDTEDARTCIFTRTERWQPITNAARARRLDQDSDFESHLILNNKRTRF
jgi:hypothetical protein